MQLALELKEELVDKVIGMLYDLNTKEIKELALSAGVCPATLYNWMAGTVLTPRTDTMCKVLFVLGHTLKIEKMKGAVPKLRIVK